MIKFLTAFSCAFLVANAALPTTTEKPTITLRSIVCSAEYRPVCCKTSKRISRESNACICRLRGGTVLPNSRCRICRCPRILRPVCCAVRGGRNVTVSNECLCACRGGKVLSQGRCEKQKPSPTPSTTPTPQAQCICTHEFRPVCCQRGTKKETANNACECKCDRGNILSRGRCRGDCFCPAVFMPVCCQSGGERRTAVNSCGCGCRGGTVVSEGACPLPRKPCLCAAVFDPVCCLVNGKEQTEGNSCECGCVGGRVIAKEECRQSY